MRCPGVQMRARGRSSRFLRSCATNSCRNPLCCSAAGSIHTCYVRTLNLARPALFKSNQNDATHRISYFSIPELGMPYSLAHSKARALSPGKRFRCGRDNRASRRADLDHVLCTGRSGGTKGVAPYAVIAQSAGFACILCEVSPQGLLATLPRLRIAHHVFDPLPIPGALLFVTGMGVLQRVL
jgi:hypothetical protein